MVVVVVAVNSSKETPEAVGNLKQSNALTPAISTLSIPP
jgi:hypothetical protein